MAKLNKKPVIQGQTLLEYALIIALIAVVLIAASAALTGGTGNALPLGNTALD